MHHSELSPCEVAFPLLKGIGQGFFKFTFHLSWIAKLIVGCACETRNAKMGRGFQTAISQFSHQILKHIAALFHVME